ncbi:MAG: hypothetical protein HGA85_04970 [Nanoarchaeota archaeon]|nr:hypothetical protein [Nanoarchaeota archaeon]
MIGKPEWFKYRIFGWGISPKTWQGWIYAAIVAFAIGLVTSSTLTAAVKPWVFGIVFGVIILDVIHIMMQMPKKSDERENYHQLLIERNCSFAAVGALTAMALYQAYQNRLLLQDGAVMPFDMSIAVVFFAMLLTKVISTFYVRAKM